MGFDYYNPKQEMLRAVVRNIAMWMLDTDYDDRSLSFTGLLPYGRRKRWMTKLAKNLKAEIDEEKLKLTEEQNPCLLNKVRK